MKILSVNAGSSSLKFSLIELPEQIEIANGLFEKIGIEGSLYTVKYNGEKIVKEVSLEDHSVAVKLLMEELIDLNIISSFDEIDGVGHRLVHGGDMYSESIVLNEETLKNVEMFNKLAPLHNPANIMGVRAFMKVLPNTLNVGVFDTAFHQTMKPEYFMYPVPFSWYKENGVRKYGFHGTSHRFINKTISEKLNRRDLKVIVCHIGNGASIAAIDSGKVVDTTMGFTPLAGLMMGTRCGDIDPSIIEYMCHETGRSVSEITSDLNKKSGYLGISELSSDGRDIEKGALEGNEKCILANEMYSRKVANYIAMYNNILNGADVICFTAGVGENSVSMRKQIISKITSLGVKLDEEANGVRGEFKKISLDDSKIDMYIVPTNEELMIALDTMELKN